VLTATTNLLTPNPTRASNNASSFGLGKIEQITAVK
jgi:hypothetical protein